MKYLFLILGVFFAKAQKDSIDHKLLFELNLSTDFSPKVEKQNPLVGFGLYYRYPLQDDVRLELGGEFKTGATIYHFQYGKNGGVYDVNSKGYFLDLGGRMVKDVTVKGKKLEWISALSINTMFFDGTGIPDDPIRETDNQNTTQIIVDAEAISSLQFGQGIRFWNKNVGFGLKANFTPYRLWYKSTVPNQFNIFSIEASILLKL